MTAANTSADTLADRLEARSEETATQLPAEVRDGFAKGIDAVADSGILDRAKNTDDKAPDFLDADYRKRAELADIVVALEKNAGNSGETR